MGDVVTVLQLWMRQVYSSRRNCARARRRPGRQSTSQWSLTLTTRLLLACPKRQLRPGRVACARSRTSRGTRSRVRHSLVLVLTPFVNTNSISVIFSYVLQNSIQTVSVAIVSQLGSSQLSVAAFSLMLAFVTG
jgi:hypothetical protein